MAEIIAVLPEAIANQIAAGEVIQRPASVVKELMENAVDAGADRVDLIVKDAGRTLIQVIDNGKGMSPLDARMSWERHATSKIRKTEDLFSIRSFGFRGEALASIAAVAQVEMKTKSADATLACHIGISASNFEYQKETMAPDGTNIQVKNLFFNIPARRNFLKSNAVELKHIVEEFTRVSLPNPSVAFSLTHNDNRLFELKSGDQQERIAELLSCKKEDVLFGDEDSPAANYRVYLGKPEISKRTRGDQYFIVNGRYIKDPYLNHAIVNTYKEYLPEDHFPAYVVFLDLDPSKVDINVHPTKTEIKFEDEKTLYVLLKSVVKKVLASSMLGKESEQLFDDTSFQSFFSKQGSEPEYSEAPKPKVDRGFNPFDGDRNKEQEKRNLGSWQGLYEGLDSPSNPTEIKPEENLRFRQEGFEQPRHKLSRDQSVIQLFNAYLVTELNEKMLVIDQQRAHQRVMYERFINNLDHAQSASQQLLFPRALEFSAKDAVLLEEIMDDIRHLGFDISPIGNNSFMVNGLPAESEKAEAKQLLEGLLEEFKASSGLDLHDRPHKLAHALAKKSSIKQGRVMSPAEMLELVSDLMNCKEPYATPDGKQVMLEMGDEALAKWFKG